MKKTFEGNLNMCEPGKPCTDEGAKDGIDAGRIATIALLTSLGMKKAGIARDFKDLKAEHPLAQFLLSQKGEGADRINPLIEQVMRDFFVAGFALHEHRRSEGEAAEPETERPGAETINAIRNAIKSLDELEKLSKRGKVRTSEVNANDDDLPAKLDQLLSTTPEGAVIAQVHVTNRHTGKMEIVDCEGMSRDEAKAAILKAAGQAV